MAGEKAKQKLFVCPFTSSSVGSCQLGGWNEEGRNKFNRIRKHIKAGRQREGVLEAEYESAARLYRKYGWHKKEKPSKKKGGTIDLSGAVVAFGDEEVGNDEVVGVDVADDDDNYGGAVVAVESDNEAAKDDDDDDDDDEQKENEEVDGAAAEEKEEEEEDLLQKQKVTGAKNPDDPEDQNLHQVGEDGNFLVDKDNCLILFEEEDDATVGEAEE